MTTARYTPRAPRKEATIRIALLTAIGQSIPLNADDTKTRAAQIKHNT